MAYMIDARIEHGAPSLVLIDSETGEERLHWRGERELGERGWRELFKRLAVLSCADRMSLVQRVATPGFGDECLGCVICDEQSVLVKSSGLLMQQ